ncbi:uncharacterized protein LOC120789144 isoform X1 [Xiphias gladius]|uniref:uncharacterized protein LOC120789144 isoform X1 n=1 Tax=Xiphias gladius TaxID=8245 RepID=UPI001A9831FF|nr:uncharacterized protein LOC120789144 isoform X1 [Xiphias gladius]XP_039981609.1 uncharacterized protein LOC120789144 isoform X1 [Xiphias gladius]XP_039981610.1 uncharacterized protein LOC120789144 isoform X1 [Xiphias gladius]XP_039981611.1 uncharacterized protein LOC120789144 isoform X1 [Xiphias gladius]XP_039981612.1 uncharacterized protein LOC120789144 isoform X1 [Xiphias gladius]
MMAEFRWIKPSLFLVLVLRFAVAAAGQNTLRFNVRVGGEVALPCQSVRDDQVKCNGTAWLFDESRKSITLFEYGKIHDEAKSKSDRLSVTENCSLVIKKVTVQDVGRYTCRQFDQSGQRQGQDATFPLSVVTSEAAITGKPTTTIKITRTKVMTSEATNDAGSINNNSPQGCWWWYIIVSVVLAALIISIVLIIWKKTIGNKTQTEEDMADPDGGVSYATISYARKTDREARVQGDAVIYSTVEAPSSSAGASTAPSSIYATVNKPNK